MGAKKTTLAFVILTWNSERVIERCVRSVFALKSFDVSAYVVDNGSSDKTVEILDALTQEYSQLHVIKRAVNEGTTIPRNLALKEISPDTDYICVLDSDTEVNDGAIQEMVNTLSNKRVGIVGPEMRNEEGVLQAQRWGESLEFYSYPSDQKVVPVGYLMSACWMFRPEILDQVGYLDEKIFYAPEDVDFCLRCWMTGLGVVQNKNARILHSWQRLSRKKLFSKHNWEHIKGLAYLFTKHRYLWSARKIEKLVAGFARGML